MKGCLWLLRIMLLIGVISIHVTTGQDPGSDEEEEEGAVEMYILAREEVQYELEEFYSVADPGDEPDMNSDAMENLRAARDQLYKSGFSAKDIADLIDGDPGLAHARSKRARAALRRLKRTIEVNEDRRWTKALVPYMFTNTTDENGRNEINRAMRAYERFTCIRFVPWSEKDGVSTNQKLGLDHESYLSFVDQNGCWSYQGNIRRKTGGQKISCCSGTTCVHEMGHAMGESHEQQSPNPDRLRMIRIDLDAVEEYKRNSYTPNIGKYYKSVGYDLSTYMHYSPSGFNVEGMKTFIKFFPELPHKNNYFYLMKEVSLAHQCQERCKDFPLTCENDGYVTQVDNKCACNCIPGLDPATGCTTIFKKDPKGIAFPGESYAIPAHSTGCPDESFVIGSRTQVNDGSNLVRKPFGVGIDVTGNVIEKKFCIHDSPLTDKTWPGVNLCVYRRGGKCPDGFNEGFVQYNDLPTEAKPNTKSGELPDGVFTDNTRFEYCCSNLGFSYENLILPSRKPFALIKRQGQDCQNVRGMHVEVNSLRIGNAEDEGQIAQVGGDHPMYLKDKYNGGFWTSYCNYKPAMIDCGEIFNLDYSNPQVTISSPKAPELECYWMIKAPEGERLQMDFSEFDIKGNPGSCIDVLEVRYVRIGQPGVNFCGPRWDKTTISINNTIYRRLSTHGDSPSRFTATIKIVKDENLCYSASDRGMTYNGDVSFTRDFEPCLPWAEMSHCEMHPFQIDRFNSILEGNRCRNPDQATGFQPWCYVKAEGCIKRYCDVCLIRKRFDLADNCKEMKAAGQCSLKNCAKTCADQYPQPTAPGKASEVRCLAPGPAPDGSIVGTTKNSYKVGESVEYKCDYLGITKVRYCLSSGDWSSMGTACSKCPDGFSFNRETKKCYFFPNIKLKHYEAAEYCEKKGGFVAFPVSEEENIYLKSFTPHEMFLGITDIAEEGKFVTSLGEPVKFTKWGGIEPNNDKNREDCGALAKDGTWKDMRCYYLRPFVCQAQIIRVKGCLDFSDKCTEHFAQHPAMCRDFLSFAEEHCKYTCGLNNVEDTPKCKISNREAGLSGKTDLKRGESFEISCDEGMIPISGDKVRGCQADGTISGKPLECTQSCPKDWTFNLEDMFCYKKFDTKKNFAGAEAVCAEYSGTLASAADNYEQEFLYDLKNAEGPKPVIWLGLTDSDVEGSFKWTNGKILHYSFWKKGEPNNNGNKGADCVQMNAYGQWSDSDCVKTKLAFVCKAHVGEFGKTG